MKNEMIPAEAKKHTHHIVDKEMPEGLQKYLELELFPQVHLKVGKGISISTACWWLHQEGLCYIEHKKGLYYDCHDWPDVLDYCQNGFLPLMEKYHEWLVESMVGDVDKEVYKPRNCVERLLVILAQDESTMQAHDREMFSWVLEGEQPLKHKVVVMAFTKVQSFAQHLGGWKKPVSLWNMVKITKAIGLGDYLWSR